MDDSQEATLYRITNKHVATAVVALVALVGAYPMAYKYSAPITPDRYTGTQGDAHEARTAELERWQKEINLRLQGFENSKQHAYERIAKHEQRMALRDREYDAHVDWARTRVQGLAITDAKYEIKLNECLRRTK